jgi:hypothetical protein
MRPPRPLLSIHQHRAVEVRRRLRQQRLTKISIPQITHRLLGTTTCVMAARPVWMPVARSAI